MSEYLIKGETLTNIADNIRSLTGATDSLTTTDMSDKIIDARIEVDSQALLIDKIAAALEGKAVDGGLDTSDATVTAEQMPEGVTAYAKGEKITGTAQSIHGSYSKIVTPNFTSAAGGTIKLIQMQDTIAVPTFFGTTGATGLVMQSQASEFGDATAEDVAKGKTFTSAAGLKVEGTMEENGGESAETCTVTFDNESISSDCAMYAIIATVLEDGERKTYVNFASDLVFSVNNLGMTFTIPNVVCGTKIYMIASIDHYTENGAYVEIIGSATYDSNRSIINSYDRALFEFTAPSVADEHCTIYYAYNT